MTKAAYLLLKKVETKIGHDLKQLRDQALLSRGAAGEEDYLERLIAKREQMLLSVQAAIEGAGH